jgi:hypothetical protein
MTSKTAGSLYPVSSPKAGQPYYASEVIASKLELGDMQPSGEAYDFNTAFQNSDGQIVFWEDLNGAGGRAYHFAPDGSDGSVKSTETRFPLYFVVRTSSKYAPPILGLREQVGLGIGW